MWHGTKMNRYTAYRDAGSGGSDEEDAADHRIKIYKELHRHSDEPDESSVETRLHRQMELAASRHPRWRGGDGH
jgi:hypothetical protein